MVSLGLGVRLAADRIESFTVPWRRSAIDTRSSRGIAESQVLADLPVWAWCIALLASCLVAVLLLEGMERVRRRYSSAEPAAERLDRAMDWLGSLLIVAAVTAGSAALLPAYLGTVHVGVGDDPAERPGEVGFALPTWLAVGVIIAVLAIARLSRQQRSITSIGAQDGAPAQALALGSDERRGD